MGSVTVRTLVFTVSLACLTFSGSATYGRPARPVTAKSELTAHEWGTFTSIAGRSGEAVKWLPLSGPTDLPGFVEHFGGINFKVGLQGTVRMETPVLYFYSARETTVSVKVSFSKGVITEWYPHASRIEPNPRNAISEMSLYEQTPDGSIRWNSVTVAPGLAPVLPRDNSESHYYAARETASAPVVVRTRTGMQQEKFLFYRGVAAFELPIAAQPTSAGKVLLRNLQAEEIPAVILFERRGEKLGYRLGAALRSEELLDPPELTSTVESMSFDLQGILIANGLFPDEARAMIETWRNSWFEEGSRLFYIVPPRFVSTVLPLDIKPAPSQITRVFVGRLELITPATEHAVEQALATHDRDTVAKYGRFLGPILGQLKAEDPAKAARLDKELTETYEVQATQKPTP